MLALLIQLQAFGVFAAKKEFSVGDTLYVWANDGLVMREEPRFDSPSVVKLDYGTADTVLEGIGEELEFVEARGIHYNKTTWQRISVFGRFVKIQYMGMEGFIFDGFLSRLVPMHDKERMPDYFNRAYGQLQMIDRSDEQKESGKIIYKTGIMYEFARGREKAWNDYRYFIPDISMNEAYLLINRSSGFEENYKRQIKARSTYFDPGPLKFSRDEIVIGYALGTETIENGHWYVAITGGFGN